MSKRQIEEGAVFLVPLDRGKWAVGVISRTAPKRGRVKGIYAFFFGAFTTKPSFTELRDLLRWEESSVILKCGALHLHDGSWPFIGKLEPWNREDWPLVKFLRIDELTKKTFCVIYDEDDFFKAVSEVETGVLDGLVPDGVYGAAAVEAYLSHKMSSSNELN